MAIYIEEFTLTFEMLQKIMDLPEWVKIVGMSETTTSRVMKIRFASERPLLDRDEEQYNTYVSTDDLTNIGNIFRNPDRYKKSNKGTVIGTKYEEDC